ncbi:hypothetical protein TSOC_003150 [Tetrabaena socialis]|uniref:Uncharacterized protein n=1 Tax=Tetrabaena socialis TaxID=47790 RepID=A0A2J8AC97_9CHLO|nr:hypothetical protein TSOC_003150 [Tetrabaena socialis]|eukprot:PNH10140.1 hypothetical protein TSOC_003150 [Tetrabaena socialis]
MSALQSSRVASHSTATTSAARLYITCHARSACAAQQQSRRPNACSAPRQRHPCVRVRAEKKEYYDYKDMPPLPLTVTRIHIPKLDYTVVSKQNEEMRLASLAIFYDIYKDEQYKSRLTRKSAMTALCMYDRDDVQEAQNTPGDYPNIDLLFRVYNQGMDLDFVVEEFMPNSPPHSTEICTMHLASRIPGSSTQRVACRANRSAAPRSSRLVAAGLKENVAKLAPTTDIARVRVGSWVLENVEGKKASVSIYAHLAATYGGKLTPEAAKEGLQLYGEVVEDAKQRPGAHPSIDLLLRVQQQAGGEPQDLVVEQRT